MTQNKCYKQCRFFKDDDICKVICPEQNCYKCEISDINIIRKDYDRMRLKVNTLQSENKRLKELLGDKALKEQDINSAVRTEDIKRE